MCQIADLVASLTCTPQWSLSRQMEHTSDISLTLRFMLSLAELAMTSVM